MTATPAVPLKGTKAIVGAILAGVIAALGVVATDLTQGADWTQFGTYLGIVLPALIAAGIVGPGVYQTTNKPKV